MPLTPTEQAMLLDAIQALNEATVKINAALEVFGDINTTIDVKINAIDTENNVKVDPVTGICRVDKAGTAAPSAIASWQTYSPVEFSPGAGFERENGPMILTMRNRKGTLARGQTVMRVAHTDSNDQLVARGITATATEFARLSCVLATASKDNPSTGYELNEAALVASMGTAGHTYFRLNLKAADALESVVASTYYTITPTAVLPSVTATLNLGASSLRWANIYSATALNVGSDVRDKTDIQELDETQCRKLIMAMRPVSFKHAVGSVEITATDEQGEPTETIIKPGTRDHFGLVAQELETALSQSGITDAAVWCLEDKNDPESRQSIRYEELIAPMLKVMQEQQRRIETLETALVEKDVN